MAPGRCLACWTQGESTSAAASVTKVVRQPDLNAAMGELRTLVEPWASSRVIRIKTLQEAVRNQGHVELVRDIIGVGRFSAVKRMPVHWVCSGPEEFNRTRPRASEKPWVDMALLRLLAAAEYPYSCRLQGIFRTEDEMLVATSFCTEGDLFQWCFKENVPSPGPKREAYMQPIVWQLVDAVRWLHDLGIAHRDISLENTLLTKSGAGMRVKLIDFGMATVKRWVRNEVRGKGTYQAPEMHACGVVDTFLLDSFSVGVVLFAMATQDYPWSRTTPYSCPLFQCAATFGVRQFISGRHLRTGDGELLGEVLSTDFLDILDALLKFRPKKRACLGEACFRDEVGKRSRLSVWDSPYFMGANNFLDSKYKVSSPASTGTGNSRASTAAESSSSVGSFGSTRSRRSRLISWLVGH
mmetsp:Transcript_134065/g.388022  ORF Transcript_134065/g.388022 Transcript_134065/m.388022 type:complete len:411 (-) Transcript_134065:362-1594(-)